MYTPRGRGRAASPRRRRVRLASATSSAASRSARSSRAAAASARRAPRAARPAPRPAADRAARGPGRASGSPRRSQSCGDLLVGEDHQLLDQPVGLGLRDGVGARPRRRRGRTRTPARSSRDLERRAARRRSASAADARRASVERRRRSRPAGSRCRRRSRRAARRRAGVGADPAAVEARRRDLAASGEDDLGGHREPVDARGEAAGLVAERRRQHRLDRPRDVGAVGAPQRLGVERRRPAGRARRRRRCGSRA